MELSTQAAQVRMHNACAVAGGLERMAAMHAGDGLRDDYLLVGQ